MAALQAGTYQTGITKVFENIDARKPKITHDAAVSAAAGAGEGRGAALEIAVRSLRKYNVRTQRKEGKPTREQRPHGEGIVGALIAILATVGRDASSAHAEAAATNTAVN